MKTVTAISKFDHGGMKRHGDRFEVSDQQASALERRGLVRIEGESKANPTQAAGKAAQSSASPAAQASAKKIANKSAAGAKPPKAPRASAQKKAPKQAKALPATPATTVASSS